MKWKVPLIVIVLMLSVVALGWRWYSGQSLSTETNSSAGEPSAAAGLAPDLADAVPKSQASAAADMQSKFTLTESLDYEVLRAHYQASADAGDPYARRVIAQIYDFCVLYSLDADRYRKQLNQLAEQRPELSAQFRNMQEVTEQRCKYLDDGLPIPIELIELSRSEAQAAGDPVSILQNSARMADLSSEENRQLLDRIFADPEPEALIHIGTLMSVDRHGTEYADVSGPSHQQAWWTVACRRGGTALCGANSPMMMSLCRNGICFPTTHGFEAGIRQSIAPGDLARFNQRIAAIEEFLRARAGRRPGG